MPGNRNILYLIIGALIVVVAVLGYNVYQTKKQPEGLQINLGPNGLKIREQVRQAALPMTGITTIMRLSFLLLGGFALLALASSVRPIRCRASRTSSICGWVSASRSMTEPALPARSRKSPAPK